MVFDSKWFIQHQELILLFANSLIGRYLLRIHGSRSLVGDNKITEIGPNFIIWQEGEDERISIWTHNKFSKRLRYSFGTRNLLINMPPV
jgi:hypothetical protein